MDFTDFELSSEVKRAVTELGFTEPTDIQERSIPLVLEGKDIIGFSQTGSGKTAAYGLPAVEGIDVTLNAKYPQVLILCPTRELAMQVTDELHKFSKYKERVHVVPVYGGQPMNRQIALVRSGCQIVVGTPGRVMDLIDRKLLRFEHLKTVVLDEADEMLDMGFREDIETILSSTPDERQTLLFSATMPEAIVEITGKYQHDPVMVKVESRQMTAVNIEQSYFEIARGCKKDSLALLLQYYRPKRSLVFCNTKKMVDELTEDLIQRGFTAEGLHGDMKQLQRTQVMNRFKSGAFSILIATDVAARGIDVDDINIVFNFDLPVDPEYYVHRIGRTARAGKTGASFTFVQGARQYAALRGIAKYTKSTINKKELPTVAGIKNQASDRFVNKIAEFIEKNTCSDCMTQLEALRSSGLTDEEIALGLIKMNLDKSLKAGTVDVAVPERRNRTDRRSTMRNDKKPASGGQRSTERRRETVKPEKPAARKPADGEKASSAPRRRERTSDDRSKKKFEKTGMETVTISVGRKDKITPKHILGAVAGESGLPGSVMGMIDIHSTYTTVEVPAEYRSKIVKSLNKKSIKGKEILVK